MKLKLLCLLLLSILTLKGQNSNSISNKFKLEWVTFYCGGNSNITTGNDTLIVSPNPFDSIAVIEFTISNNDSIWLDIYNVTGHSLKSYYNGAVLSSGSYTLNFNGDTLPNGIYFVRLKNSLTTIQTVKLIKNANAVGINENSIPENNFVVYPNPTTSIINIENENNQLQNTTIELKNYLGQLVFTSPFTPQINLHSLSAGMYFLTVEDKNSKKTVKIIKQ